MGGIEIAVEVRRLELAEPFTIAKKRWEATDNLFVRVTSDGVTGLGECMPEDRWGETPEGSAAEVEAVDPGRFASPFDLETLLEVLPPSSARCALDIAMHDLAATLAGVSLAGFLGLEGRPLPPTSVTVPIGPVDAMVRRAQGFSGYPVIKLKVGFDGDVDAVGAIRAVFPGRIRIDANEGWGPGDAIERLREMERFDIELCEQPIPHGDREALAEVTRSTSIPVFADEDVNDAADVAALAGVVDGVNLKLRKTGGLREALRAVAVARALGMQVMIGCDLTSGIAATAEATFAALTDHADVDGPLLLAQDPHPGVAYDRGRLTLPAGPGLGVAGR